METITITKFKKMQTREGKPFWVVEYLDDCDNIDKVGKATIGAWDVQIANYIENDVGVEGSVSVLIEQKGDYTNITKVDMTSAKKGTTAPIPDQKKDTGSAPNPQRVGLYLKLAVEMANAAPMEGKTTEENLCENVQEIKKLEDFVIGLLG